MKIILLAVLLFWVSVSFGQNLIPNGTLEDANICVERQQPCSPSAWFNIVKETPAGYFSPGYGSGYRYLTVLTASREHNNRWYWQTMLLCPLVPGEKYTARIRVAANGPGPNLHDIGFYFTDGMVAARRDTLLQPDDYFSFMGAKAEEVQNSWFQLEKEFVATAVHQYLIVGNFSKESNRGIFRKRGVRDNAMLMNFDDLELVPESKAICPGAQRVKDSLYAIRERHSNGREMDTVAKDTVVIDKLVIDTVKINNIQFELDSYTLKNESTVDSLRGYFIGKDIKKVQVVGYTDNSGSDEYNRNLSEKRAREISRLIVVKFGIAATMIVAEGRGISNDYADKSLNRRVEVYIYH